MNYSYETDYDDRYGGYGDGFAADAAVSERVAFIRRTYAHLFGAILVFLGLITLMLSVEPVKLAMFRMVGGNWWICFIAYYVASLVAQKLAQSGSSVAMQYFGLALYTVAEVLIFMPLLVIAEHVGGPQIIPTAGFLTMIIFGGLTAVVFLTRKDFSFLRMGLSLGSLLVFGLIIASFFVSFTPNFMLFIVIGMIALLSGYILYDTSNVLHHYRTDQHVAASLALFSSVATLFYYVIYLLTLLSGDD